jgi:gamma-glutamylcyclotransferase (GGCT)/AIG2-like uncharacterized protein YtfP
VGKRDSGLFVYGALLDPARRLKLLGREVETRPATLGGYARMRARHYYIVRRAGTETRGAILVGLGARDFRILDEYEEVPRLYTRERIEVNDGRGATIECWIYMPTALARAARQARSGRG